MTTKGEQETIIRWDQEKHVLHLYTAHPPEARKWARRGYAVEVCARTQAGEPRGWRAQAPLEALRLRKLVDGKVAKRRRGRVLGVLARKLAESEPGTLLEEPPGGRTSDRVPEVSNQRDPS